MPKLLDVQIAVSDTVVDEQITSFTIDEANAFIFIVFDQRNAAGVVVLPDLSHTISGVEMQAAIARSDELVLAGSTVYAAIKQALYEYLPGNGTVV